VYFELLGGIVEIETIPRELNSEASNSLRAKPME
jgi:hypothetical protein